MNLTFLRGGALLPLPPSDSETGSYSAILLGEIQVLELGLLVIIVGMLLGIY